MKPQAALDRLTDAMLSYRPKDKGKWAKRKRGSRKENRRRDLPR